MFFEKRATELAISLLHIGGLSGAAAHLANNDPFYAIVMSIVASLCVILLTATVILCEMVRLRVHGHVRKHKEESPPPGDEDDKGA